jgi:hypothetical protein
MVFSPDFECAETLFSGPSVSVFLSFVVPFSSIPEVMTPIIEEISHQVLLIVISRDLDLVTRSFHS